MSGIELETTGRVNVVVDLSHHNAQVDFARLRAAGIVGVIHKATQGSGYADPAFEQRRTAAQQAGLWWGAYHFGDGSDAKAQADHFLKHAQADASTLRVLDYEANPAGTTMALDQAREFVDRVHSACGRSPGLYSGSLVRQSLGEQPPDPVLGRCFLWLASYGGVEPTGLPPTFAGWTFWQYTDGVHGPGPRTVDGVGPCDRDLFNGTMDALRTLWGRPRA